MAGNDKTAADLADAIVSNSSLLLRLLINGWSALGRAVVYREQAATRLLLAAGADPQQVVSPDGHCAVWVAASNGLPHLTWLLLEAGGAVEGAGVGETPLEGAVRAYLATKSNGYLHAIQVPVEWGASTPGFSIEYDLSGDRDRMGFRKRVRRGYVNEIVKRAVPMTEALRKETSSRRWQDLHALKGDHPCLSSLTVAPHCGVAGGATPAVAAVASPTGPPVTISALAALTALRADLLAFPAAVTRGAVMGAVADGAVRDLSTLVVAHSILSYAVVLGVLCPTDDHDLHETIYERVYFGVVRRLASDEVSIALAAVRAARRQSVVRPSAALTLSSFLRYDQLVQADLLAVCHRLSCVEGDAVVLRDGGRALLEYLQCLRQQPRSAGNARWRSSRRRSRWALAFSPWLESSLAWVLTPRRRCSRWAWRALAPPRPP